MIARRSDRIPNHISFILDGNRRWAKDRGLSTLEGHRKGYDNLLTISRAAFDEGCEFVSAFIFSTENWNRSKEEVGYLMNLVLKLASNDVDKFLKEDIKVVFLGSRENVPENVQKAIDNAEAKSRDNKKGTLALCFNYGGQTEMVDALYKLRNQEHISKADIEAALYHPEVPAIDFLIRTSGEQRLSNFMLWRLAYAELYFVKKHWPAFTKNDLRESLKVYAERTRRFGK